MHSFSERLWYGNHPLRWVLSPLSWLFRTASCLRRVYLQQFRQKTYAIPIIVVGNISVGGVGKTPLVIELAQQLRQKGLKVGIVSRGYGANIKQYPHEVRVDDMAEQVGDEPLLLAQKTKCPVVIAPLRNDAVQYLLDHHQCQLIISDDGLQHYRMGRSIEIAVIDGQRGLGNGFCLPAGPLREAKSRLKTVDFVVVNEVPAVNIKKELRTSIPSSALRAPSPHVWGEGKNEGLRGGWSRAYSMTLIPEAPVNLKTSETIPVETLKGDIVAIAGIGNPQRFYSTLANLGIKFIAKSYPDHYRFKADDFNVDSTWVVMTEKDAVKCSRLGNFLPNINMCYLPVRAELNTEFWSALWSHKLLQGIC